MSESQELPIPSEKTFGNNELSEWLSDAAIWNAIDSQPKPIQYLEDHIVGILTSENEGRAYVDEIIEQIKQDPESFRQEAHLVDNVRLDAESLNPEAVRRETLKRLSAFTKLTAEEQMSRVLELKKSRKI